MMLPARRLPDTRGHLALHDRAIEDLRYIRETIERSQSFTAVPGLGGMLMGVIGLGASVMAAGVDSPMEWVGVWVVAAILGLGVALVAMARKARSVGERVLSGPGRKFAWSVTPPLAVGALVTLALAPTASAGLLPGVWLLLYGTAVVGGGAFSVRIVPLMGICFIALGAVALFAPHAWGDLFMAAGFGGLQLLFGAIIWRRHGG